VRAARRAYLGELLVENMVELALQMYGCRVIQKGIEVLPPEIVSRMTAQLRGHVVDCVQDQNGNHVIQKCIEVCVWVGCLRCFPLFPCRLRRLARALCR
jgi:pumilio RNA-binding family